MRVFVTGGNGFIGSVVVRKLIGQGHAVRCLLRPTSNTQRISDLPYEPVLGDVRDPASLEQGARGCDGIIHLAGLSAWSDIHSPLMPEVVVGGTRNLLAAAKAAGGPRTVVVSTSTAVNGTETPVVQDETSTFTLPRAGYAYAHAKSEAEAACREAARDGLAVVVANPCEVYGPHDTGMVTAANLVDFAKSSPVLVCSGGTSVVYVDDVADGLIAALTRGRPGERYILGGENLTIGELAQLTLDLLSQQKRVLLMPNWAVRAMASAGTALHLPLPFEPAVIPYATRYWFMDNTKARGELGASFRSARETLAPTLDWLVEAGHIPRPPAATSA